jgi:thiol-disulfide isomerase/thioredoxin
MMKNTGRIMMPQTSTNFITNMFSNISWKMVLVSFFILATIFGLSYYFMRGSNNTVYQIDRENMDNINNAKKNAEMMLFYVDWCPHCKTAKPEWENLKNSYEGKSINGYNMIFTEYNCTDETPEVEQLMNKFKIEGYPTIKLIKDNQVIEYDAKPTKATMEQFLNSVL